MVAPAVYTGDPVRDLRAVYEQLARMELSYDMSRINDGAEMEYRFQRVRFPSVTLAHRRMNCIDGTVLFASCAESLGHRPAVVFVHGHAFLALLDGPLEAIKRMAFVETNLVCSGRGSYHDALAEGMRQFGGMSRSSLARRGSRDIPHDRIDPYCIVPIELARELKVLPRPEWLR